MNKIKIPLYVTLGCACVFSVLSIHFALDASFFAFPLSAVFCFFNVWFLYFKVYRNKEFKSVLVSQKLLQYLPYVLLASFILRRAGKHETVFVLDCIQAFLWAVVLIARYLILHHFNEKNVYSLCEAWKSEKKTGSGLIVKPAGKKRLLYEIVDWVDALVQAVFMVLIIQIFFLQLYVIPSESMVPSFLIGDRVVVLKTPSGPKMPLSDAGFPCLKKYSRGDVVVFRNPHYRMDRKSEIKTVVSQIVYMLTFSGVNLNVDEKGEPKADPLVKRICGVPGEQLVMQDGVLYTRTSKSDEFKPCEFDNKYACWNLNAVSPSLKKGIQCFPLSQNYYDTMLEVEQLRRELDYTSVVLECNSLVNEFALLSKRFRKDGFINGELNVSLDEYKLFSETFDEAKRLMMSENGTDWYRNFMTSWISNKSEAMKSFDNDPYSEANYRLNLMAKLCVGRIILRNAQLIAVGSDQETFANDLKLNECFTMAEKIHFYLNILDQRNMPLFPANAEDGKPQYIPSNCYFMMGDNRFNSLDMRHSYVQSSVKLTSFDEYSVCYNSNMAPQYVNRKYILGNACYRFWPLPRRGFVQTK